MDLRVNFFGVFRFVGAREQLDAGKKPTGKVYVSFSFEGGMMEILIDSKLMVGMVEGNLYQLTGNMEPVYYTQSFGGQTYQRQGFRVQRVTEIKPVK